MSVSTSELRPVAVRLAAEKAAFTREGIARNAGYLHNGRVDLVVFSLVPSDLETVDLHKIGIELSA